MIKCVVTLTMTAALAMSAPCQQAVPSGSWHVDARHSDAKVTTDGTTDFGREKLDVVLGFGRVNGEVDLRDADATESHVDLRIYPATSMQPVIAESGQFETEWLMDRANQMLLSFHSRQVTKTTDGKLQAIGELKLVRVARSVQIDPNEAYSGPVYGPPVVHSVSREATFVFDLPDDKGQQSGVLKMSGSTAMTRQAFPQIVRAVVNTYWPPLVQDANCKQPANLGGEDYRGGMCSGRVLQAPALPEGPYAGGREDYPGPGNYNAVSGNELNIVLHIRLLPAASTRAVATDN